MGRCHEPAFCSAWPRDGLSPAAGIGHEAQRGPRRILGSRLGNGPRRRRRGLANGRCFRFEGAHRLRRANGDARHTARSRTASAACGSEPASRAVGGMCPWMYAPCAAPDNDACAACIDRQGNMPTRPGPRRPVNPRGTPRSIWTLSERRRELV